MRLVGLGGRPAPDASRDEAVARLAATLTRPSGSADRYYFALVVADRSAALVGRLLEECGEHPVITQLPIRCRGLASLEDRLPGPEQPEQPERDGEDDPDGILVAPTGMWCRAGLVHEVQQFARELLQDFASAPEAGLTSAQLGRLRPDAGDDIAERPSPQPPLDELTPVPADRDTPQDSPAAASTDVVPCITSRVATGIDRRRTVAPRAGTVHAAPAAVPGSAAAAWHRRLRGVSATCGARPPCGAGHA